ncbi:MAG: hypothetical protein QOH39_1847 [Verrucomicrobiota bacterium]
MSLRTFLFEDDGELRRALASRRAHRSTADERGSSLPGSKMPAGFGGKSHALWPHLLFWPAALAALLFVAVVIKNGLKSERPRTANSIQVSKNAAASEMDPADFYSMSEPGLTTVRSDQEIAAPLSGNSYVFGSIYYVDGFPDLTALTSPSVNGSSAFTVAGNSSSFGAGSPFASTRAGGDVPAAGPADEPSHDGSAATSRIPDTGSTWALLLLSLALVGGFKAFTADQERH